MQDEERTAATAESETEASTAGSDEAAPAESSEGTKAKAKRAAEKPRRSHAERAMANIRSAKKGQREVSDPVERARFLLAEANVLALLELADAISGDTSQSNDGAGSRD
jgi:hypothetical protein